MNGHTDFISVAKSKEYINEQLQIAEQNSLNKGSSRE